jgi:hypothetical protein
MPIVGRSLGGFQGGRTKGLRTRHHQESKHAHKVDEPVGGMHGGKVQGGLVPGVLPFEQPHSPASPQANLPHTEHNEQA